MYGRGLFPGDVVAFHPPDNTEGEPIVRRVAAIEGEEMVSDDPADEAFRLPEGSTPLLFLFAQMKNSP